MDIEKLASSVTRVHSVVEVKAVDDEKREFRGIATTPSTDRMDDIVEPSGAQYTLPISLLWQHDRMSPVGSIVEAKATKNGIEVRGTIPKIDSPPGLAARLDEAWASLKHKLVTGLSIGFSPKEYSFMDNGGVHFTKWDWHELSLVTIPANAEATITSVKSLDQEQRAALGKKLETETKSDKPAGASANHVVAKIQKPKPEEGKHMNIAEQIKGFEETRKAKAEEMSAIMEKASESGETLDQEQSEAYDTLKAEIKSIDSHLVRLKEMEAVNKHSAEPVEDQSKMNERAPEQKQYAQARVTEKLEPGIQMARVAKCVGLAKGNLMQAQAIAQSAYAHDKGVNGVLKAAVAAGTTTNSTWAGALVGDESAVFADFLEYLRPQTILGRFGANGVPGLRRVPARVPLIGQTSGGSGYWVGEGNAKPLTKFDFERKTLEPLKVANIAVVTMEVLRDSSPSAEMIVRDQLVAALRERLDTDFIDPSKAEVAGISPASITNGATPITSAGPTADNVREDLRALFAQFIAANNAPTSGVWVMSATTALALSLMQNPLGQAEFPGITMNGGTLFGLPTIVSEYVPSDSSGGMVALVNASDVYLVDDGGFSVDMSDQASLQMDNAPTNDSHTPTPTNLVSLWQTNSVGFRAERTINWAPRRASAVAVLTGVTWGQ